MTVESGLVFFFFFNMDQEKEVFWLNTTHHRKMLMNKICIKYAQGSVLCGFRMCSVFVWPILLSNPT